MSSLLVVYVHNSTRSKQLRHVFFAQSTLENVHLWHWTVLDQTSCPDNQPTFMTSLWHHWCIYLYDFKIWLEHQKTFPIKWAEENHSVGGGGGVSDSVSSPVVLSAQMEHACADCVFTPNHISFLSTPSPLRTVKSAWVKQKRVYRKSFMDLSKCIFYVMLLN